MLNLEALNEAQRTAVMHGEGPLLVLAGPGSGKTFTITQRIFYLIEVMKVAPEEILVITFTRDAALSMQSRFQEQSNRIYPVNFGTFHSVFYQILRTINGNRTNNLMREDQKRKIINPIIKKYQKEEQWNSSDFLSAISYIKNTGDKERAMEKLPEQGRISFDAIFSEYEAVRKHKGYLDFDDMLYECGELLKSDAKAGAYWKRRFAHILVDEFQDINPAQFKVIRLLTDKPYNLFAVGDDDQAIYGFRGSNPACMQQFVQEYAAKRIILDVNYRSYPDIIAASCKVIHENKNRFLKEIKACEENRKWQHKLQSEIAVLIKSFTEKEEQYTYLAKCLSEKSAGESCAVLFRTNMQMQSFAVTLKKQGIPYEMKEKNGNIYEHFVVKDIMSYFRIAGGESESALWIQILNKPRRSISREALWNENGKITLEKMKQYHVNNTDAIRDIILLEKQLNYLKNATPYLGVQYICKIIGYEHYLEEECRKSGKGREQFEEWLELVDWLKAEARKYHSMKEWLEAQQQFKEELNNKSKVNVIGKLPSIQLMTVHASKGLEFDRVYLPDCNEKIFPHGTLPDKETCEEERRIFYVAMTRAKKHLELLYLTGTKERPRLPSRFLNPLLD